MTLFILYFVPKNHLDNEKSFRGVFPSEQLLLDSIKGEEVHNIDVEIDDFDDCYVYEKVELGELL
ncbi:MAG TPA: hypothetical protein VJ583_03485 [Nitrososphaeraceae archaeon]|nr:hypothetical protein [Nitrososphaeraceae archaeon]